MKIDRRKFIKITSIASATLLPVISFLAYELEEKDREKALEKSFNDTLEFHIIDNNLLNLHFYFINVIRKNENLIPDGKGNSFMIVRLPQMHMSEKGYWQDDWKDQKKRLPNATLSGYSYLAFQLWPERKNKDGKIAPINKVLKFDLENLLNWNNNINLDLITLVEWFDLNGNDTFNFADYTKCDDFNKQKVWNSSNGNTAQAAIDSYYIKNTKEPANNFNYKKYKSLVHHFLDQNLKLASQAHNFIPITFLEIPQGTLLVPIARDERGGLAKGEDKPIKKFWRNEFVNQNEITSEYRKYEVWNNTLFYTTDVKTEGEINERKFKITTPSFRIVGLITDIKIDCPDLKVKKCEEEVAAAKGQNVLPSLLDKTELAFLTQFAMGEGDYGTIDFRNEKFDIKELNGLFFTGLGIITHLRYYNEDVPKGIDLIEYEHIITEGRDIFIKVARIGIHNKNGKRYKHVIEGKRKIVDDAGTLLMPGATSFIELKQYCECIEARKVYEFTDSDITLWNAADFVKPVFTNQSLQYFTPASTNEAYFRRFTWKEIRTIEKKRIAIDLYQDKPVKLDSPECTFWFWPIFEGTLANPKYLNSIFDADDWDNGTLNLSTPFIFIRKSVIETNDAAQLKEIADSYFLHTSDEPTDPVNLRRKILINNQKIAFTKPLPVKSSEGLTADQKNELLNESKNKTHILETDFIEHYYNINNKINNFSKTRFPLLPQTLRAKVYIDHIRDLTQEKIASVVQYHEDYLKYVFTDYTKSATEVLGNGAKLILENTVAFRAGAEEKINDTYQQISNALHEAKDRLGNLSVPDIIPESISLEKLGITAPNDIKISIEKGKTVLGDVENGIQKISSFNPRELLRGKLSDVCGLDLTAILDELIPANSADNQTPLFEINKIANQISDQITNSDVFKEINTNVTIVKDQISKLEKEYVGLKTTIDADRLAYNEKIKQLTDVIPNADDLRNMLKTEFENLKTEAFGIVLDNKYFNEVKDAIEEKEKAIRAYVSNEIIVLKDLCDQKRKELAVFENDITAEVLKIENQLSLTIDPDIKTLLENIKNVRDGKFVGKIIDEYTNKFNKKLDDLVQEIDKDYTTALVAVTDDLTPLANIYFNKESFAFEPLSATFQDRQSQFLVFKDDEIDKCGLIQLQKKIDDIHFFIKRNTPANDFQSGAIALLQTKLTSYNNFLAARKAKLEEYIGVPGGKLYGLVQSINQYFRKNEDLLTKIGGKLDTETRGSIVKLESLLKAVISYIDILRKIDPYFYYTEKQRIEKEIKDVKRRIENNFLDSYNEILLNVRQDYQAIIIPYTEYAKAIKDYYADTLADPNLQLSLNEARNVYDKQYKKTLLSLSGKAEEFLKNLANKTPEYKKIYDQVVSLRSSIDNAQQLYKTKLNEYTQYINEHVNELGNNLYDQLEKFVIKYQDQIEKVNEARNLLRLLTSIKKQDLTYSWSTTSFRDINLGIVAFKKFSNPDTKLKIDVRATTEFSLVKFPPVIDKITTYSENRFSNFGISFFNILTIGFSEISFIAGSDHSTHFDVKIKDVKFDGALSFVQKFESFLKTMGKGLILKLESDHVALGYCLPIPAIKTPAFSFFNLSLNFDLRVYFDKRPLRFGFSLATAESKFGIAATIYAGFGFFGIVADPKNGIVEIECALEAGVWAGISIGPIAGEVKLAFGFYYRKNEFGVRLEGYIVAEGRLSVWILEVSARIYLGIISENGVVEGECTVSYSVKLGFVSKSFSGSFHRKIAGAESKNREPEKKALHDSLLNFFSVANAAEIATFSDKSSLGRISSEAFKYAIDVAEETQEEETYAVSDEEWEQFINSY